MSDAYSKCQSFLDSLNNMENALFTFSKLTINGFDISSEFGNQKKYKDDDKYREIIVHRMKTASSSATVICRNANALERLNSEISKRSYGLSHEDSVKLKELIDKGLYIDGVVRSYVSLVFDYFDDDENCSGMRYSNHILLDVSSTEKMLERSLDDIANEIYETSELLKRTCVNLKNKKIKKLFKAK